jgi:hypothetical protein
MLVPRFTSNLSDNSDALGWKLKTKTEIKIRIRFFMIYDLDFNVKRRINVVSLAHLSMKRDLNTLRLRSGSQSD